MTGTTVDRKTRADLNSASMEYIAPSDYMVRPPQPCLYVFVIDVTATAVSSGMVHVVCDTIRLQLDNITGDKRTRVGIITFDDRIHFYNLKVRAWACCMAAMVTRVSCSLGSLRLPCWHEWSCCKLAYAVLARSSATLLLLAHTLLG